MIEDLRAMALKLAIDTEPPIPLSDTSDTTPRIIARAQAFLAFLDPPQAQAAPGVTWSEPQAGSKVFR